MPTFDFTSETMPTPDEFARMLREASEQYDPVEELLRLERELVHLEEKYDKPSAEFYRQYRQGLAGDAVEIVRWAGLYELYLDLKQTISNSLKLVLAVRPEAPIQV